MKYLLTTLLLILATVPLYANDKAKAAVAVELEMLKLKSQSLGSGGVVGPSKDIIQPQTAPAQKTYQLYYQQGRGYFYMEIPANTTCTSCANGNCIIK